MEFIKNNISYIFIKNENEPDDIFIERCWFIISKNKNNLINMQELEKLSYIWVNIKFLNCKYSDSLTNKVNKMSKYILISDENN